MEGRQLRPAWELRRLGAAKLRCGGTAVTIDDPTVRVSERISRRPLAGQHLLAGAASGQRDLCRILVEDVQSMAVSSGPAEARLSDRSEERRVGKECRSR